MDFDKQLLNLEHEIYRNSFAPFVKNTVPNYIDGYYLNDYFFQIQQFYDDVLQGKSPRLIINMPPRHLKSETATIRLPLFAMLNNPRFEVIIASANQDLSNKFSRISRDLVEHDYIKKYWNNISVNKKLKSVKEWGLSNGSVLKAVGIGGQTNGYGGNIVILDDPIKSLSEALSKNKKDDQYNWLQTVLSRRLAPGGGIIIVLTRWAEDDVAGRLIKEFGDRWKVVKYKAIAEEDESFRKIGETLHPTRFKLQEMLETKNSMAPEHWQALYQQNPRLLEGNLFKKYYFDNNRYHPSQLPKEFDYIFSSWDFPFKKNATSDFVAGLTFGMKRNKAFLLNIINKRLGFIDTVNVVLDEYYKYKTNAIVIEAKANGEAVADAIKDKVTGIIMVNPCEDKVTRGNAITSNLEAGDVLFPTEEDLPEMLVLTDQALGFPRAAKDDLVDALTQAISHAFQKFQTILIPTNFNLDIESLYYKSEFTYDF
ncbi:phage terminase large subunit [Silvanigrella sp.]|uniref:phage terminase large subunit n=1 Tax=Silvanigrella sp. TaxID=2024976 RepID=UPI0037C8749A